MFGFGWPRLIDVPSKRGTSIVIGLVALAAIASAWWTGDIALLALVVAGA